MRKWQKILISIIANLLALFVILLGAVSYIFADTVLSSPPVEKRKQIDFQAQSPVASPYTAGIYESVPLTTSDDLHLHASYHPPQNGAAVILLHAYRQNHTQMFPIANMLVEHGYGVILVDLRGHGQSDGNEVTFGVKEVLDAEAAYLFLLAQHGVDADRIGILGNSLGGATAILYGAQNSNIKAVAAHSPFASLNDVIWANTRRSLPTPPILLTPFVTFWVRQKLGVNIADASPLRHISEISPHPVFIMMGGKDVMTDPVGGQRLIDAAGEPKIYWYDADLNHLEFQERYPEEFERRVSGFFDQYLK